MTYNKVLFEPGTGHENEQIEYWTIECLIDQLFLNLCSIKQTIINDNGRAVTIRKYYALARNLMRWIPIARLPSNEFVINISDIRPAVRKEIESVANKHKTLRYILTQAVGRIFENLDFEYYHLSVARNLRVRFEP
jgi:invasion protein IalB